jgi:hypothetical protein
VIPAAMENDQRPDMWHGWHRAHRRAPWLRLVTQPTYTEALQAALDLKSRGGDWFVRQGDADPNRDGRSTE